MSQSLAALMQPWRSEAKAKLNSDEIFLLDHPTIQDQGFRAVLLPYSAKQREVLQALAQDECAQKVLVAVAKIEQELHQLNAQQSELEQHKEQYQVKLLSTLAAHGENLDLEQDAELYQLLRILEINSLIARQEQVQLSATFLLTLAAYLDLYPLCYFLRHMKVSGLDFSPEQMSDPVFSGLDLSKKERIALFAQIICDHDGFARSCLEIVALVDALLDPHNAALKSSALLGLALLGLEQSLKAVRLLTTMRPELTTAQILDDLTQLLSNRVQPAFISFNQLVKSSAFARLQAQNKQAQVDPYDPDLMEVGPKNRGPLYRKHKELTLTVASDELKALSADATTSSPPDSTATPASTSAPSTLSFAHSGNLDFHDSNPFARSNDADAPDTLALTPATASGAANTAASEQSTSAIQSKPTQQATSGALALDGLAISPAAAQSSGTLLETSNAADSGTDSGLALTPATAQGAAEPTASEASAPTTKSNPTSKASSGALALDGLAVSPAAAQSSGTLLATSNASSSGTDSGLDLTPANAPSAAETTESKASAPAAQPQPTTKAASGALALGGLAVSPAAAESSGALLETSNATDSGTDSGLALTPATASGAANTAASEQSTSAVQTQPSSKAASGALALSGLAVSPTAAESSGTLLETSNAVPSGTDSSLDLTPATASGVTASTAAAKVEANIQHADSTASKELALTSAAAVTDAPTASAALSGAMAEADEQPVTGVNTGELSLEAVTLAAPEFDLSADTGNSELAAQASLWRQEQAQTERVAAQLAPTQPTTTPTKAKSRNTSESNARKSKKGETGTSKRADKSGDKGADKSSSKSAGKRRSEREARSQLDFSGAPATEGRVWRQSDLSERLAQENSSANWVNSMVRARYGASSAHAHFDERVKIFSRRSDNTTTERTIADIRAERQRRLDAELNSPSFQSLVAAKAAQRAAELAAQAAAQTDQTTAASAPEDGSQAPSETDTLQSGTTAPAVAAQPTKKAVRPVKYVAPILEMVSATQAPASSASTVAPETSTTERTLSGSGAENTPPELNAATLELNLGGDTPELILTAAQNHSLWTSFLGSGDKSDDGTEGISSVTLWHNPIDAGTDARSATDSSPKSTEAAPSKEEAEAKERPTSTPSAKPRLARSSSRPTANVRRSALGTAWSHAKAPTTADLAQDLEPEMRKALVKYGFLPDPEHPEANTVVSDTAVLSKSGTNKSAMSKSETSKREPRAQESSGASTSLTTSAPWDVPLTKKTSRSSSARAHANTNTASPAVTAPAPAATEDSHTLAPEIAAAPVSMPSAESAHTSSAKTTSSAQPLFDFVHSTMDPDATAQDAELAEVAAAVSAAWDESAAEAGAAVTTNSAADEDSASADLGPTGDAYTETEVAVDAPAADAAADGAPWADNVGPADQSNRATPDVARAESLAPAESAQPATPAPRRRKTKAAPSHSKAHDELDDIAQKLAAGESTLLDQDERAQINAAAAAALFGADTSSPSAKNNDADGTAAETGANSGAAAPEVDEQERAERIKRARELRRQAAQGRMVLKEIRTLLRANHRSLSEIPTDAEFDALSPDEQARMSEQAQTLLTSLQRELGIKSTTPRPRTELSAIADSTAGSAAANVANAESSADNDANTANEAQSAPAATSTASNVVSATPTAVTALSPELARTDEIPHYNDTVAAAYQALAQTDHEPLELNAAQMQQVVQDFQANSSGLESLNQDNATERKLVAAQNALQAKAKLRRFAREVNLQQFKQQAVAQAGVSSDLSGVNGSLMQHPTEQRELTSEELERLRAQEQRRFIRQNYSEYNNLSAHELKATEVQATALSAPVQRLALSGITEPPLSTHLGRQQARLHDTQPKATFERTGDEGLSTALPESMSALDDIFWEGAGMEGETTAATAGSSANAARAPDPLLDLEFDTSSPFSLELQELDALLMSRPELTVLKYHWLYGHYFLLTQDEYLQLLNEPSAALTAQAQDAGLSAEELAALVRRERSRTKLCAQLRPFRELNVMRRVMLELNEHQPSEQKLMRLQRGKFNYYLRLLGRNFYLTANAHRLKAGFDPELERITNLNAQRVDDEVKFVLATILLSGYNLYLKSQASPLTDTYRALNFKPPL